MLGRAAMTLALSLFFTPCAAGDAVNHPRHEVWLGFGGAASWEKSVFNVPDDIASTPDQAISLGYMLNLDARRAIGLHVYGGWEEMTPSAFSQPSGSPPPTLELGTYNLGVRYRHSFADGALVPYAFVGASLASGVVSGGVGDLYNNGFSACVGPGASVRLGRNFKLSAEGFGSFGVATWEREPLANSSGTKFNPSLVGGTLNLSVMWGTRPPTAQPTAEDSSLTPAGPAASRPTFGRRAGEILLMEAVILLYSSAAYDQDKGTLPGLTLASVLLGMSAGGTSDFKSPKSSWILFGGMVAIVTAEFVMGNNGASQDALFWTSAVSWNAVVAAIGLAERSAARAD